MLQTRRSWNKQYFPENQYEISRMTLNQSSTSKARTRKHRGKNSHSPDTSDLEITPLHRPAQVPGRFTLSKLQITFGDKTSTVVFNKNNIVQKIIARKTNPSTRWSLKPQWNIIPDRTITNYLPHTITLDTSNRKNAVIRKNDLAIVTQTRPVPTQT